MVPGIWLGLPALVPLMECNRGCPFGCTFCVDGIGSRSRVNKVRVDRLEAELDKETRKRYPTAAAFEKDLPRILMGLGFTAAVLHQKMIRTPMFIFKDLHESMIFKTWVEANFDNIKFNNSVLACP